MFKRKWRSEQREISPEEILLDARNLPLYNAGRLEGRLNKPIGPRALWPLIILLTLAGGITFARAAQLMAIDGGHYRELSENNRLGHSVLFAERGIITDRNDVRLAWNVPHVIDGEYEEFDSRAYASTTGLGHLIGYIRMPARDSSGVLYREGIEGVAGVELTYDDMLRGTNGTRIVETDARMHTVSQGVLKPSVPGSALALSVDARLTEALGDIIGELVERIPFKGGAGVLMDVHSGELIALTSYPEYDPAAMVSGDSNRIASYAQDARTPYLNRVVSGQYTPGSIVKPFMASAALHEGIVTPSTTFVSTGALKVENPYAPGQFTVFRDWRAHGAVDMRRALAVSSDVYFYYVGGGFGGQEGLGITRIHDYMKRFGFGVPTGITLSGEAFGIIPSPEWKAQTWPDDPDWRIGNTYHTSIGQYGFQVTPLQAVRAIAAIANGGMLLTPRIETTRTPYGAREIGIDDTELAVVRSGMREAVLGGTAAALNVPYAAIAGKTGTAEVGAHKEYVHSWVVGFFPYDKPRYAFALLMEQGPTGNMYGAPYAMRQFIDWLHENAPEYLE